MFTGNFFTNSQWSPSSVGSVVSPVKRNFKRLMSAPTAKFSLLLDLAKETSSERRRDLLREITNMLVRDPSVQTLANCATFDEIAVAVVADLKAEARNEMQALIGYAEGMAGEGFRVTWKSDATGRPDWKGIAEKLGATPELIAQHMQAPPRRFLVRETR